MIARVSGRVMVKVVPWPYTLRMLTAPPRSMTLRRTTSMPTPRPDRSVVAAAVEKPASKISSATASSDMPSPEAIRPRCTALATMASRLRPAPSSATSTTMEPPRWKASMRSVPVSDLPAPRRLAGISRPWSMALRTRWTSGSPIFSSTVLSSSVVSPRRSSTTFLSSFCARSRTRRGKRLNTVLIGSMRMLITLSCSSRVWRASWPRP